MSGQHTLDVYSNHENDENELPIEADSNHASINVLELPTLARSTSDTIYCTPNPLRVSGFPHTSPLSSPPPEESLVPPSAYRRYSTPFRSTRQTRARSRLMGLAFPPTSSPLSSPPPVLFDPFEPSSPSDTSSSRRSSISQSELDETPPTEPFASSQTFTAQISLPHLKGKDLFDVSVWSDPLKTSVFYRFTTSLRQKSKDCEPTSSHHFISHLRDRGKLVRCYTQNIDQLEEKVGLSTSLQHGPGSKGRFSRRSTANGNQLAKMVEEANATPTSSIEPYKDESSQPSSSDGTNTPREMPTDQPKSPNLPSSQSGVECVFLHGSLERLRCFLCSQVCSWDDTREVTTLLGQQPECPHCVGATVAREKEGKRALGVGKLRPDIVLYGEEHPNAHLIGPIITHDLSLCPDMLLILGTSLRVHGLKVMVKQFANAIHNRGGKVVFVNYTKPPESEWGDVIDYWVQWDCDTWVTDLQARVPKLWEAPLEKQPPKERPPAKNPVALRDTRITGAHCTQKILEELYRLTGNPSLIVRVSKSEPSESKTAMITTQKKQEMHPAIKPEHWPSNQQPISSQPPPKPKRSRKSAPGALDRPRKQPPSTLNPNHNRATKATPQADRLASQLDAPVSLRPSRDSPQTSILHSVKSNPRIRRPKLIDGAPVPLPKILSKPRKEKEILENTLAPLRDIPPDPRVDLRPRAVEPLSPPAGPDGRLRISLRTGNGRFCKAPLEDLRPVERGFGEAERDVARTMAGMGLWRGGGVFYGHPNW